MNSVHKNIEVTPQVAVRVEQVWFKRGMFLKDYSSFFASISFLCASMIEPAIWFRNGIVVVEFHREVTAPTGDRADVCVV
jgi:hypothetical protein